MLILQHFPGNEKTLHESFTNKPEKIAGSGNFVHSKSVKKTVKILFPKTLASLPNLGYNTLYSMQALLTF